MVEKKLIDELYKQYENLAELNDICNEKKNSLVNRDIDKFNEVVKSEERLLMKIHSAEKSRVEAVIGLLNHYGLKQDQFKLKKIIDLISDRIEVNEKRKLLKLEAGIKDLIKKVREANKQNLFLIQNSRKFITETINTLIKSADQKIIDRKG